MDSQPTQLPDSRKKMPRRVRSRAPPIQIPRIVDQQRQEERFEVLASANGIDHRGRNLSKPRSRVRSTRKDIPRFVIPGLNLSAAREKSPVRQAPKPGQSTLRKSFGHRNSTANIDPVPQLVLLAMPDGEDDDDSIPSPPPSPSPVAPPQPKERKVMATPGMDLEGFFMDSVVLIQKDINELVRKNEAADAEPGSEQNMLDELLSQQQERLESAKQALRTIQAEKYGDSGPPKQNPLPSRKPRRRRVRKVCSASHSCPSHSTANMPIGQLRSRCLCDEGDATTKRIRISEEQQHRSDRGPDLDELFGPVSLSRQGSPATAHPQTEDVDPLVYMTTLLNEVAWGLGGLEGPGPAYAHYTPCLPSFPTSSPIRPRNINMFSKVELEAWREPKFDEGYTAIQRAVNAQTKSEDAEILDLQKPMEEGHAMEVDCACDRALDDLISRMGSLSLSDSLHMEVINDSFVDKFVPMIISNPFQTFVNSPAPMDVDDPFQAFHAVKMGKNGSARAKVPRPLPQHLLLPFRMPTFKGFQSPPPIAPPRVKDLIREARVYRTLDAFQVDSERRLHRREPMERGEIRSVGKRSYRERQHERYELRPPAYLRQRY